MKSTKVSNKKVIPLFKIIVAIFIGVVAFILDLNAPLGVAGGVPYVLLVLSGWWFNSNKVIYTFAVMSAILTLIGIYASPGELTWVVFTNRLYAVIAIVAVAIILGQVRKSKTYKVSSRSEGGEDANLSKGINIKDNSFLVSFGLIFIIMASGVGIYTYLEKAHIAKNINLLTVELASSHQEITNYLLDEKNNVETWAENDQIVKIAQELLTLPIDRDLLINSSAQVNLRNWLAPNLLANQYRGYFIIDKNNINLASSRDANIGVKNILLEQSDFLARVWAGNIDVSLPLRANIPLRDTKGILIEGLPTMFAAAPIKNQTGEVVAIFTIRLEPDLKFSSIFNSDYFGKSGETYPFNKNGVLLSESRFKEQLLSLGLIETLHSGLNIEIRNPGVDLTIGEKAELTRQKQPLTKMAKNATAGNSGIDLQGYRDYRGVMVVGAWLWDDELQFGIAAEIDRQEAFSELYDLRVVILLFTGMAIFLLVILTVFSIHSRRKLYLSEVRYKNSISSTTEGFIVVDEKGIILEINKAFLQMLMRSESEVLRRQASIFMTQESQIESQKRLKQFETTNYREAEATFINKKGDLIYTSIHATTLRNEKGVVVGSFSFVRDITERKLNEDMLQQAHDNLEEKVKIRTRELQLAKDRAEKADNAKSDFLANMSHELRTPLNAIIGFSQMIEGTIFGPINDKYKEYATDIRNSGDHLLCVISDIIDISKVETGDLSINAEEMEVAEAVNSSLNMVRDRASKARVAILAKSPDKPLMINADPIRVKQILINLLTNAIKFTPPKGKVKLIYGLNGAGGLDIIISDTGIGIEADKLKTILERFGQVRDSQTSSHDGIGLGLPISKAIIELHGGDLVVESQPGSGTKVTVSFPSTRVILSQTTKTETH